MATSADPHRSSSAADPASSQSLDRGTWLTWAGVAGLVAWQLRAVLGAPSSRVWGDRTDTIHHIWGVWWAAQDGVQQSTLVSYPYGEHGSLLAPVTATLVRPVLALGGPTLAYNAMCALVMLASAVALGVLARAAGASARGAALAALLFTGARPILGQLSLGAVEGAVLAPLFLAGAAVRVWPRRRVGWGVVVGALLALSVIENPYTVLPGGMLAAWGAYTRLRGARRAGESWRPAVLEVALAALAGGGAVAARLAIAGGDLGGNIPSRWTTRLFGRAVPIADFEPFPALRLLWPTLEADVAGPTSAVVASGSLNWVGFTSVGLALLTLRRRPVWMLMAVGGVVLAVGSVPAGVDAGIYGPFFYLNALLSLALPPLTQPVRFLPMAVGALAVAAGLGFDLLRARETKAVLGKVVMPLALLECVVLGAGRVTVHPIDTAALSCWSELPGDGAVHVVEGEFLPDGRTVSTHALLMQLQHGRPVTTVGIGGWTHHPAADGWQEALATVDDGIRRRQLGPQWRSAVQRLQQEGVEWVAAPSHLQLNGSFEGAEAWECGDWSAWLLGAR